MTFKTHRHFLLYNCRYSETAETKVTCLVSLFAAGSQLEHAGHGHG